MLANEIFHTIRYIPTRFGRLSDAMSRRFFSCVVGSLQQWETKILLPRPPAAATSLITRRVDSSVLKSPSSAQWLLGACGHSAGIVEPS